MMVGYERVALEEYAEGATDAEICALLQITMKEFNKQYEGNDAFKAVIDYGRTLSKAWWDNKGRKNLDNKSFNTALFVAYRKNYHGWADKTETTTISEMSMSADELDQELAKVKHVLDEFQKQKQPEINIKDYLNAAG